MFDFKLAFAAIGSLAASIATAASPGLAQTTIDAEGLKAIQGRWVSRFEGDATEIEISGTEIRYVKIQNTGPKTTDPTTPGQVVAIITGVELSRTFQSELDKRQHKDFKIRGRCWTTSGYGRWYLSEQPTCTGAINFYTHKVDKGIVYQPVFDYATLHFNFLRYGGAYYRPEVKQRFFGNADPIPTPKPTPKPVVKPTPAPVIKPAPKPASGGATPSGKVVPEAPPAREAAEREKLNSDQAAAAKRQLEQNAANQRAYDQAVREREAAIARQKAEYQAALARTEAERLRREQEHAAAIARWQADVEACKKGDKSRCAK